MWDFLRRIKSDLDALKIEVNAILRIVQAINSKEDRLMSEMDDLKAAVTKLQTDEGAMLTFLQTIKDQNTAAQAQIAALQAQIAAGNPISAADVEAMAQAVNAIDATVTAALPAA